MKHIVEYYEFISEKVNLKKYLPSIKRVQNNAYPPEIKAFLDVIAFAEGTTNYPNNGYNTQFTGKQFNSYSDHPREVISASGLDSTAAGRYQFLSTTWDGLMRGKDFTPKNQDEGAVKLLKQTKAYRPLLRGDLKKALYRTKDIWASFPWSKHGQGAWYAKTEKDKLEVLTNLYYTRLKHYNPSADIPEINIDADVTELSKKEKARVGRKRRMGRGYSKGDSAPFIVGMSSGENVKKLQTSIIKLGGSLPVYGIDGLFGPETMGASKFVLTNLADITNTQLEGTITNELSENNIDVIIKASENEDLVKKLTNKFGKSEYKDYSQNLPMVDGEIVTGGDIFNVEYISKTINKIKNKQPIKIYHIGDSHIKAHWLTGQIKDGLSKITNVTYDKNAENGWTVNEHLKNSGKIENDIKENNYDLVIISLGGNDSNVVNFKSNRYKSSYVRLIELIKNVDPNVEFLLTTPTPSILKATNQPNQNKKLTQSVIYDIGSSEKVAVWDIFKKLGGVEAVKSLMDRGMLRDGVHFYEDGYRKIGDYFIADIKKYLK
jgi:muramidase (phage lysozyme)/lysophospholipase L1-like esterase